jgi:hypothetical protein
MKPSSLRRRPTLAALGTALLALLLPPPALVHAKHVAPAHTVNRAEQIFPSFCPPPPPGHPAPPCSPPAHRPVASLRIKSGVGGQLRLVGRATAVDNGPAGDVAALTMIAWVDGISTKQRPADGVPARNPTPTSYKASTRVDRGTHKIILFMSVGYSVGQVVVTPVKLRAVIHPRTAH